MNEQSEDVNCLQPVYTTDQEGGENDGCFSHGMSHQFFCTYHSLLGCFSARRGYRSCLLVGGRPATLSVRFALLTFVLSAELSTIYFVHELLSSRPIVNDILLISDSKSALSISTSAPHHPFRIFITHLVTLLKAVSYTHLTLPTIYSV